LLAEWRRTGIGPGSWLGRGTHRGVGHGDARVGGALHGLGAMWGEQKALEYLGDTGFRDVAVIKPEDDLINCYYICRKT